MIDSIVVQEFNSIVMQESDKLDMALRISTDLLDDVVCKQTDYIARRVQKSYVSS